MKKNATEKQKKVEQVKKEEKRNVERKKREKKRKIAKVKLTKSLNKLGHSIKNTMAKSNELLKKGIDTAGKDLEKGPKEYNKLLTKKKENQKKKANQPTKIEPEVPKQQVNEPSKPIAEIPKDKIIEPTKIEPEVSKNQVNQPTQDIKTSEKKDDFDKSIDGVLLNPSNPNKPVNEKTTITVKLEEIEKVKVQEITIPEAMIPPLIKQSQAEVVTTPEVQQSKAQVVNPNTQVPKVQPTAFTIEDITPKPQNTVKLDPVQTQISTPPNLNQEQPKILQNQKEQSQQEEMSHDSFSDQPPKTKTNSPDSPGLDEITAAIRTEILEKQHALLVSEVAGATEGEEEKTKISGMNPHELREYLASEEGREVAAKVLNDKELHKKLNEIEVAGYKEVHTKFQASFKNVEWTPGEDGTRSTQIKNDKGELVADIKETTHNTEPKTVTLADGTTKTVSSYRTIDFPKELETGKGPLHMSMAVKDENGKNIAANDAVYFTAHYDDNGKLTEVSSPQPVKFIGDGPDAVGYIERDGKVYTLPVTREKYQEMMKEVGKNQGMGVDLSQKVEVSKDQIQTKELEGKEKEKEQKTPQPGLEKTNEVKKPQGFDINTFEPSKNRQDKAQDMEKVSNALVGKTPKEALEMLKTQVENGRAGVVGLMVEAMKNPIKENVPNLTQANYQEVYTKGMGGAPYPHTKAPSVMNGIHDACSELTEVAGVTREFHTNLRRANTDELIKLNKEENKEVTKPKVTKDEPNLQDKKTKEEPTKTNANIQPVQNQRQQNQGQTQSNYTPQKQEVKEEPTKTIEPKNKTQSQSVGKGSTLFKNLQKKQIEEKIKQNPKEWEKEKENQKGILEQNPVKLVEEKQQEKKLEETKPKTNVKSPQQEQKVETTQPKTPEKTQDKKVEPKTITTNPSLNRMIENLTNPKTPAIPKLTTEQQRQAKNDKIMQKTGLKKTGGDMSIGGH